MVPLESSPLLGVFCYGGCSGGRGGFTEAEMIREATINNQDSSGETCSISDQIAYISSPQGNKDDGSASKNDVVSCINIEDNKDKSWLRLGIGPEENTNGTASHKVQRCCSKNARGRENSLELSLFSSTSTAAGAFSSSVAYHLQPQQPQQPPYSHDQLLSMRGASLVYNHQLTRPQTLINAAFSFPSSTPWIPQYMAPCRPSSLGMMSERNVINNNNVTRSCCVEEGGAGPSSEFRVLEPPKRPHSGLWFLLQASQFQEKEPFLPQVNKRYLRIKDGKLTVRLLIKYLMKKLQLDSESEMLREHVSCRAHALKKKSEVSSSLPLFLSTGSVSPMIGPPFGSLFQVETEKRHLASRLLTLLGVPHIATGDLVHEELASLGPFSRQLSEIVNQGKLVSDEIIVNLLSKRLEAGEAKGESGFILYGFPRTMRQAEMLGDVTDISLVVNLKLPEEVLVDKCLGRRMQQRFQRRAH